MHPNHASQTLATGDTSYEDALGGLSWEEASTPSDKYTTHSSTAGIVRPDNEDCDIDCRNNDRGEGLVDMM